MAEVFVDSEKLVYGLEKGIGHSRTLYSALPKELRLRYSACGLVTSAIFEYLKPREIPVKQVLSSPNLSFDPGMKHVVPIVGGGDNPTVIDASYSQFLSYAGISASYEKPLKESSFPDEKIIDFKISERDVVADWLTTVVGAFQNRNAAALGPLARAPVSVLYETYTKIWNPENFTDWSSISYVQEDGQQVAKYIPPGAITA